VAAATLQVRLKMNQANVLVVLHSPLLCSAGIVLDDWKTEGANQNHTRGVSFVLDVLLF
jgi:hypothetical protein